MQISFDAYDVLVARQAYSVRKLHILWSLLSKAFHFYKHFNVSERNIGFLT